MAFYCLARGNGARQYAWSIIPHTVRVRRAAMGLLNLEHTRIGFWGQPQFTRSGMWWFTLFFGFFGFHHLYMRSPQTAVLTTLINIISLGFWWAYDLVQLSSYDDEHLNKYGLDSPFGPIGLAQGMWASSADLKAAAEAPPDPRAPPSPTYALFYFLLLPLFTAGAIGLVGDIPNAFLRLLYFFPLTLLFLPALGYDLFRAFGTPKTLFERGHSRFMPFTFIGFDKDGHSPNLQKPGAVDQGCPPKSFFESLVGMFQNLLLMGMPFLRIVAPGLANSIEEGIKAGEKAVERAKTGVAVASKAVDVAAQVPAAVGSLAQTVANPMALIPPQAAAGAAVSAALSTMKGGASSLPSNSNDIVLGVALAGTLLLVLVGGFFVTGLRNLNDEPPAPGSSRMDDSPPKPGTV